MHTITINTDRRFILGIIKDRTYQRELIRFALPIALQQLIMSSLNMVAVIMIGQLGEVAVASVGLANQIFFLLQLVLFGTYTGAAMFTAQFWGKGDIRSLRRVQSLALLIGLFVSFLFMSGALFTPNQLLGIYSRDPAVISLGSKFLRIFGLSFPFAAISFCFAIILRSTGEVKIPMIVSTGALVFNTLVSYVLIFGKLGFSDMGVGGAAISTLLARSLEAGILLVIIYHKQLPSAPHIADFKSLNLRFVTNVFKPILPVILNETFWSLGITTYFIIYARISTESIAAMNIVSSIESMALVLVHGISHATAIMIGNRIGSGKVQQAFEYAIFSLLASIGIGIAIGILLFGLSPFILGLYKVGSEVIHFASRSLIILACLVSVRSANVLIVVGILRSGGDTRFSFFLDGLIIWILGVPMGLLTAFVLKLPVYWVYLAVMSEEIVKCIIGIWRIFSKKWIHNMTIEV